MTVLLVLNAALALGSSCFGLLALARPAALAGTGEGSASTTFYARMYASRAVPLGVAVAAVVLTTLARPEVAIPWLVLAGTVQALDALIGLGRHSLGMVIGPSAAAVVHLLTAALVAAT